MPRTDSRATISSLKATHTAHRMANEILNPPIPVAPIAQAQPSEPIYRPLSDDYLREARSRRRYRSFSFREIGFAELLQVGFIVFLALLVLLKIFSLR